MKSRKKGSNKPLQVKKNKPKVKTTKVEVYGKKTFKNNWSNTKTVYSRPR
jgi:hypothetical protein